jgi:hypothetical protein
MNERETEMDRIVAAVAGLRQFTGLLAPYIILALVMPGGIVMALLLFLHRHRLPDASAKKIATLSISGPAIRLPSANPNPGDEHAIPFDGPCR